MFKKPLEEIKKDSKEREQGKVCELAFGYMGGVKALPRFNYTCSEQEAQQGRYLETFPSLQEEAQHQSRGSFLLFPRYRTLDLHVP